MTDRGQVWRKEGKAWVTRCPLCESEGHDESCDNLRGVEDGRWCCAYQGFGVTHTSSAICRFLTDGREKEKKAATCFKCKAEISFVLTANNRKMQVDPDSLATPDDKHYNPQVHRIHFDTCSKRLETAS